MCGGGSKSLSAEVGNGSKVYIKQILHLKLLKVLVAMDDGA